MDAKRSTLGRGATTVSRTHSSRALRHVDQRSDHGQWLHLQRLAGNMAVQRLVTEREVEQVLAAIGSAVRESAASILIKLGYRDETKLTNYLFWAEHPSMAGRKIQASQKGLAQEWLRLRDEVVRPMLKKDSEPILPPYNPLAPPNFPDLGPPLWGPLGPIKVPDSGPPPKKDWGPACPTPHVPCGPVPDFGTSLWPPFHLK